MITIPDLTPELLAEIGQEVGGCDFTRDSQRRFLSSTESCDVQAAPGNGKTTLIVAKLALLARSWISRSQGVCVISHTNAARIGVESKLVSHPAACAFLGYPHFIGTVTAFIDRFVAHPYLRGLGWTVRRIDDAVFETIAKPRLHSRKTLRNSAHAPSRGHQVESWIAKLELSPNFVCDPGAMPQRLAVRNRGSQQPGPHTNSGVELEQIKAELTRDGFFRFGDMAAIATQALDKCPAIIERLRKRFPLVILDEAQDTNGTQLAMLDRLFGQGVVYQRLGDQNQTLYEDPEISLHQYWQPAAAVIPLDESRRFRADLAAFASRLTVRRAQAITGRSGQPAHRCLLLFDRPSIARVLPAYADEVRSHWDDSLAADHDIWAVASRHNLYSDTSGEWPKSLVDYHPGYRSGSGRGMRPDTLCSALRQAAIAFGSSDPATAADHVSMAIADLLHHAGYRGPNDERPSARNLWRLLASKDRDGHLPVRKLIHDRVLRGHAPWDHAAWNSFISELAALTGLTAPAAGTSNVLAAFLAFIDDGAIAAGQHCQSGSQSRAVIGGIRINLGSIHSVKGRTVDSILVVETEVYRGRAMTDRAMDLSLVLPHAFGLETRDFTANNAHLTAATNVFVGITRPRRCLVLAMRKETASQPLIQAAEQQGWILRDVCDQSGPG